MDKKVLGDVLPRLLKKVPDANKLSRLLEPENLLELLQRYGQNKAAIRQALKSGTLPGELLLDLLDKEPSVDVLLAYLGAKPHRNFLGDYYWLVVLTIIALTCIIPALMLSGFFPGDQTLTLASASLIAAAGGAIAGGVAERELRFSWKGMLIGIAYALGTLWATYAYTRFRTSMFRIEIAVPLIVGGIPALAVWYLLLRLRKSTTYR